MRRAAAISLAALALLAGCGGDSEEKGTSEGVRALADAAEATRKEGTARVSLKLRSKPRGEAMFRAQGVAELDGQRSRLVFTYDRLEGLPRGTKVETITAEGILYVRAEGVRRWTPSRDGQDESATGIGESLPYLAAVTDDVMKAPPKRIRGVQTTAYRATVDLDRVDEQLPAGEREAYRAKAETLATKTLPIKAYIDPQNRVRRLEYDIEELVDAPDGKDPGFFFRADFYDFGARSDLSAPPRRLVDPEGS